MKYIIINLSPRKKGTSNMLANYFADRISSDTNHADVYNLYTYLDNMNILLDKIKESDCIVLIGPSYVDTYPADTINLLMSMADGGDVLHGQSLYGLIQGGMPYIHTHEHGIKLLANFADNNSVNFKGGFVMGGGAFLNGQPLEKIIGAKKMVPAVNTFIEHIKRDETSSEDLYKNAAIKMPGFIARLFATIMCHNIKKDLKSKGIDFKAKSPYIS